MRRLRQVRLALRAIEDKEKKAEVRRQIRQVRDNPDMEACLAEACECEYEAQRSAAGGPFGGELTDFLTWLMDHQSQIIAFIKQIIELFAPLISTPADPVPAAT